MPNAFVSPLAEKLIEAFVRGFVRAWQVQESAPKPTPRIRTRRAEISPAPPAAPPQPRSGSEIVRYQQGHRTFDARIIKFDPKARILTLERLVDGKRVLRPSLEVYMAGR